MNAKSQPDSKDLVIAQLKREIMELKISDNDYNNINSQLGNLERRYTQLKQEKNENEVEFSKKTEHQMKTLASLKTEVDSYFSQIGEKENEFRGNCILDINNAINYVFLIYYRVIRRL